MASGVNVSRKSPFQDRIASSIPETAEAVGVSKDLIRTAIRQGKLEAKKAGRRTIITHAARDLWLAGLPPIVPEALNGGRHGCEVGGEAFHE